MNEHDRIRLAHMLDAALEAQQFAEGETRDSLVGDRKLLWALVKAIEIVGEAAARLSEDVQRDYPQIPWRSIIGMRKSLIHAYFDIEVETVWKTVTNDLPPLIAALQNLLAESDDASDDPTDV